MRPSRHKILTEKDLNKYLREWRKNGEKIVFTNGCFDILHPGHIDFLEKARRLGDRLVVGVNSDDSVRRLKGTSRPVYAEVERTRMLAALEFVDAVTVFSEDTPLNLVRLVLPDVLVKGSDHEKSNIVGSEIVSEKGGIVKIIPIIEGYSTTSIIKKIKG